jgi:hypothetical protein
MPCCTYAYNLMPLTILAQAAQHVVVNGQPLSKYVVVTWESLLRMKCDVHKLLIYVIANRTCTQPPYCPILINSKSNPIRLKVAYNIYYVNASHWLYMCSSDTSKSNNLSTFGSNLWSWGRGMYVATCALAKLYAYTWTTNNLGGDDNHSIIIRISHPQQHNQVPTLCSAHPSHA